MSALKYSPIQIPIWKVFLELSFIPFPTGYFSVLKIHFHMSFLFLNWVLGLLLVLGEINLSW